jgi:hypothetical protein
MNDGFKIVAGALIGLLLGGVNNILLLFTVKKTLTLEPNKGKRLAVFAGLTRYFLLFCELVAVIVFLGKGYFFAAAAGLAAVTLLTPIGRYYKNQNRKGL